MYYDVLSRPGNYVNYLKVSANELWIMLFRTTSAALDLHAIKERIISLALARCSSPDHSAYETCKMDVFERQEFYRSCASGLSSNRVGDELAVFLSVFRSRKDFEQVLPRVYTKTRKLAETAIDFLTRYKSGAAPYTAD